MSQKRKNQIYTKEQKADAVKYFMDSDDDNCSESAKSLGIAPSTLRGCAYSAPLRSPKTFY